MMRICGYGNVFNLALKFYLVLVFLSNADAVKPLSSPGSAHAALDSGSITSSLMSEQSSSLKVLLESEVTDVSTFTALTVQFSSNARAQSMHESFAESFSYNTPTLNALVVSREPRREASSPHVKMMPAFNAATEKDERSSLTTRDSEKFSLSLEPVHYTENTSKDAPNHERKMISTSLPAEPKQIASQNHSGSDNASSGTVPSLPVEGSAVHCELDFEDVNFGGLAKACSVEDNDVLRRRKCCPVLAAWLYSANARTTFRPPSPQSTFEMPVAPDDSQVCSAGVEAALQYRNIRLSPPNASCDLIVCFCEIRLHQIKSLSCPVMLHHGASFNFTATPIFRAMEMNCTDPSYIGCKNCLATLEVPFSSSLQINAVTSKTNAADCRIMGLLWLLATNRTIYLPTVSAVLRAMVYQSNSMQCSPDKERMPLAYDYAGPGYLSTAENSKHEWSFLVLACLLLTQIVHIR